MKFFKKSAISMAMTTALLTGGMLATQQASAAPQSPQTAGDPYVSTNGLGQALIYPYYTVREGFKTTFNVFNTSSTHAIAVKVRFREYQNSRDVLDFNLVLSPNDKWSGNVLEDAVNGAKLITADSSCTVPAIPSAGAPFITDGYTFEGTAAAGNEHLNFMDSGDQDIERLKSGYIEIIPMAWSRYNLNNDTAGEDNVEGVFAQALHEQPAGTPADCASVRSAFAPRGAAFVFPPSGTAPTATPSVAGQNPGNGLPAVGGASISTAVLTAADVVVLTANGVTLNNSAVTGGAAAAAGDLIWDAIPDGMNPLFGELALINTEGGVAGGTNAVALADWMEGAGNSLLTAQGFPYFLEPTLATAAGVWNIDSLHLTDFALMSSGVVNEWANNSNNNAQVTWTVTMPTKSFHVDQDLYTAAVPGISAENLGNIQAGVNDWRAYSTAIALQPTAAAVNASAVLEPFENTFANGVSESTVIPSLFGSEEGEAAAASGEVSFSPGSFTTSNPTLKYEANTISFAGLGSDEVLKSAAPLDLNPLADVEGGKFSGHLRLAVSGVGVTLLGGTVADTEDLTGLPMIGFALKDRDTGNSALSFGQVLDHKWMGNETLVTP